MNISGAKAPLSVFARFSTSIGLAWLALGCQTDAATYTVTSVADTGTGTLRQAILNANANPGLDSIIFSISGAAPHTISPLSALPTVTDSVIIDGTTEAGFSGTPIIQIAGNHLSPNVNGLLISAGGCTVRGLAINRCPQDAIRIQSLGTNLIQGNFLGTDVSGTLAMPNGEGGVFINGSPGNIIGGTTPSARNLISGGNQYGVYIDTSTATGNIVEGNYIGTTVTGLTQLSNVFSGIAISSGPGNLIGGAATGAGNVISGNGQSGITVLTAGAIGNVIEGNFIGVNANGSAALANALDGVTIYGVSDNVVGGTNEGSGNVISGNLNAGVDIFLAGASNNVVMGNYIGTDDTGRIAIPNQANGVLIVGVPGNVVGGTMPGAGNIISGNMGNGVSILNLGASNNLVQANFLGVDVTGGKALPNSLSGIDIQYASGNKVGGARAGNIISGNLQVGVLLNGVNGSTNLGGTNVVQGNFIGTDYSGKKALANHEAGVYIASPYNLIGGLEAPLRNLISGNAQNGVFITGMSASNNLVQGNYIGTDLTGEDYLGNGYDGIAVTNAPANTIGGSTDGAGNLISGNYISGILLGGIPTAQTIVQGNYIGTDASGTRAVSNNGGIYFYGSGSNLIGGAVPGAGNLISGNSGEGISLGGPGANYNIIQGNFIGTKADGLSPLGNQYHNIDLLSPASNNLIGGTTPGADNRIAFVTTPLYDGIRIRAGDVGNFISRNIIFSNASLGIVIGLAPGLNLSNTVVLGEVVSDNVATAIQGSLSTYANGQFLVQFYESPTDVSPNSALSGFGEGFSYIGSTNITTAANGQVSFFLTLPVGIPTGWYISATVTDSANTTWEFCADVQVSPPSLSIAPSGIGLGLTKTLTLSWPKSPAGYILQQTTNLAPPTVWTIVTNAVTASGINNSISTTTAGRSVFYRLLFQ